MKRKHLIKIIVVTVFLIFSISINVTYSYVAKISKRDIDMIMIAYMNGAAEMLELDKAELEELKKDNDLLRSVVYSTAIKYVEKVKTATLNKYLAKEYSGKKYAGKTNRTKFGPYQY